MNDHSATRIAAILAASTLVAVWGCGEGGSGKASAPAHSHEAGDDHDHGHDHDHDHGEAGDDHADHDHADHDHADHGHADDGHAEGDHDHGMEEGDGHGHGETVELGSKELDGLRVRASRDGEVTAGGDLPIDVWIETEKGIGSVRFWVGTQDAKGSVRARAELEHDNWHTHAEVPDPLPEGAALWVEIAVEGGGKVLVDFALGG